MLNAEEVFELSVLFKPVGTAVDLGNSIYERSAPTPPGFSDPAHAARAGRRERRFAETRLRLRRRCRHPNSVVTQTGAYAEVSEFLGHSLCKTLIRSDLVIGQRCLILTSRGSSTESEY
jgi:hypothetical protein